MPTGRMGRDKSNEGGDMTGQAGIFLGKGVLRPVGSQFGRQLVRGLLGSLLRR